MTFKEGNLTTVWEEVDELLPLQQKNQYQEHLTEPGQGTVERRYRWVTGLTYQRYSLHWLECRETLTQTNKKGETEKIDCVFTHITDLSLNAQNIVTTSRTGRLRWKIENEGFNNLKNGGYALEHKYSRVSYQASKNYYQLMQMAHLINQLMINSTRFQKLYFSTKNHQTLKNLWQNFIAAMKWPELDLNHILEITVQKIQFRFVI